jgi:hypothetical protein
MGYKVTGSVGSVVAMTEDTLLFLHSKNKWDAQEKWNCGNSTD